MHGEALLAIDRLSKTYRGHRRVFGATADVPALCEVTLSVRRGSRLALVGASGSGKSTLARCIALRERPSSGEIRFNGRGVPGPGRRELRRFLRAVQLIPQDPGESLNPRFTASRAVSEPLLIARRGSRKQQRARAIELMSMVGLPERSADSPPGEFSGGQRARLALARALACDPELLILDESLASLDLSIQAQMLNLLLDLQARFGLTYLLISHDLALAGHFADEVVVLDAGRIVEQGAPEDLFRRPGHPATQALVAAAPVLPRAVPG
jgi:ABC-type glutathione transport system ATPase component